MSDEDIHVDPDLVAGLGNDMLSVSVRLSSAPTAAGQDTLADLGKAGEGSTLEATYAHCAQEVAAAGDALAGAVETNGTYVLYAAQNADDAFN